MIPFHERQPDADRPPGPESTTPDVARAGTLAVSRVPVRRSRLLIVLGLFVLGLAAGASVFAVYHFRSKSDPNSDPTLLRELRAATLVEEAVAAPGDWPQWRGPRRDGVSPETGLWTDWPEDGPPRLWKAPSGPGFSALVVAGGRVFTMLQDGDEEVVVCLNADTGKELWRFRYLAEFVDVFGPGPRSTPAVDGPYVYAVGATGLLHCLEAATGRKVWEHDLLTEFNAEEPRFGVCTSPLVEGDLVLVNTGGRAGKSLAAFDKRTGKLAWATQDDKIGYSSPVAVTAAGHRQALFFTGNALVSVAPDSGKVFWRYPWQTGHYANAATPIAFSARVEDQTFDYVFISSGYNKGCALLKIVPSGTGAGVQRVYENVRLRSHYASPVRCGEHFYGFDDEMLVCMEVLTGKIQWKERGFGKGSLMAADGHLIILSENGKLAVVEASPKGFHPKASFQFVEGRCWTVPIVANSRLYLRDEKQIACFDLRRQ